ncbi:EamA family transporter [Patescibacteria group bacterium]
MDIRIILAVGSSFLFGIWPMVMRISGVNKSWANIALSLGLFIVALISLILTPDNPMRYSQRAVLLALTAGLMNGIGMLAFNKLLAIGEISKYVTMNYSLLPAISFLSGVIILNESLNIKKLIGIVSAIMAAILLA